MNQYSEKYVDQLEVQIAEQQMQIDQQANRIAELEKERQGLCVFCKNRDLTPQTKPLSDERLQEMYKKVYEEGHDNQVVALARAIEKEHGIV